MEVFAEIKLILTQVVHDWAGVPLAPGQIKETADQLADLFLHPDARARASDDKAWCHAVVQEVRRTYPFFPATAAIARKDIDGQGEKIAAGTRVIMESFTNLLARDLDWRPDGSGIALNYAALPKDGLRIVETVLKPAPGSSPHS